MKKLAIPLLFLVILGLMFIPSLNAFAEQNTGVSKQRPQYEQIKTKIKTKMDAINQDRMTNRMIMEIMQENAKFIRESSNKTSIDKKLAMQKEMIEDALKQKSMENAIRGEIKKANDVKTMKIENLVKTGKVKMHSLEKSKIEYGRTK